MIILGALFSLGGIVAIAPQVRVHQIDVKSIAAWVFRIGAIALIIGQMLSLAMPVEPALITISFIMGAAILFAAIAIVSHERQQAGFQLKSSLSLQVFGSGAIVSILAFSLR